MNDQATSVEQTSTDWAKERTRLDKERTLPAVVRTVLSFIGFGIAVAKLLPDLHPAWLAQTLGVAAHPKFDPVVLRASGLSGLSWAFSSSTIGSRNVSY